MSVSRSSKAEELSARIGTILQTLKAVSQNNEAKKNAIKIAENIDNQFTLSAFPVEDVSFEKNRIYVKWEFGSDRNWRIFYKFHNDVGHAKGSTAYKGYIIASDLKGIPFDPSKKPEEVLHPYFIDVLQILSDRMQIKFNFQELDIDSDSDSDIDLNSDSSRQRHRDDILKSLLAARDNAVNSQAIEKEENLFKLYYGLMRLKFCVDQFSMLKQPEQLMLNAERSLTLLNNLQKKLGKLAVEKLEQEYKQFNVVFSQFSNYMEMDSPDELTKINNEGELGKVAKNMQASIEEFKNARQALAKLRQTAQAEAQSGAEEALKLTLAKVQKYKNILEEARDGFVKAITNYMAEFQEVISGKIELLNGNSEEPSEFKRQIETAYQLQSYALYFLDLVECSNAQNYYITSIDEDISAFNAVKRLSEGSGHSNEIASLVDDVACYVEDYKKNQEVVLEACDARRELEKLCDKAVEICERLSVTVKDKEKLNLTAATVAAKDLQPLEELLMLKANGAMANLRRHWWKMLIGAALLSIAMAPIAIFALAVSIAAAIALTLVAAGVGAALGFGIGKLTDKYFPMEVGDDFKDAIPLDEVVIMDSPSDSPQPSPRSSTASTLCATSSDDPFAALEAFNKEAEVRLNELTAPVIGSSRGSYNPFDNLPVELEKKEEKKQEDKPNFQDDYANPFAAGFKGI